MFKGFEGYYKPNFDKLWNEATFVFDANVLLDLYRSSPNSRKEMLDILESLDGRLWIPHQFVYEYHKHKATIYDNIDSEYEALEKDLQECRKSTINLLQNKLEQFKNRTGFEIDPRDERVGRIFEETLSDLAQSKEQHQSSLNDEPLEEKIAQLFAERYCDPFEDSCLENIRKLGEERLEKGIPPGSSKDSKKDKSDPHGDLIGWLQIIKYANDEKKPVILVSNDGDWFLTHKGKVKGPYPELLQEMYDKAQVSCYIYKSSQFIRRARDFLDAGVSEGTITEAENREKYLAEKELAQEHSELGNTERLYGIAPISHSIRHSMPSAVDVAAPLSEVIKNSGTSVSDARLSLPDMMKRSIPSVSDAVLSISDVVEQLPPTASELAVNRMLEERQIRTEAMLNSIAEKNQRRIDAMMKPILEKQQRRVDAFWEEQQRRIDKNMERFAQEQRRRADSARKNLNS